MDGAGVLFRLSLIPKLLVILQIAERFFRASLDLINFSANLILVSHTQFLP